MTTPLLGESVSQKLIKPDKKNTDVTGCEAVTALKWLKMGCNGRIL
jgi:hypothetical protein